MDGQAAPSGQDNATPPVVPEEPKVTSVVSEVASKISEAHNILVALSSDPSVDEISAAIGLSLFLDKLGKRATAIYSGSTPNALEFLKPEETFESSTDTLQDFVIALNKEKADHLRYKLDGDFVKIFITPYRSHISEDDLDYSYGDFNVDLVIALDVANGIDLDSALREHGRIMHDAVIINITTGNPGKFGDIEWSDKKASSVSEMIAKLLYSTDGKVKIEKDEATAFLTGIVAATNRFSGANTTSDTMKISSRLMESGANQQLIAKNITPEIENEMVNFAKASISDGASSENTELLIEHPKEEDESAEEKPEAEANEDGEKQATDAKPSEAKPEEPQVAADNSLLDDLKAAEASLSQAGAETTPESVSQPIKIDSNPAEAAPAKTPVEAPVETPAEAPVEAPTETSTEASVETPTDASTETPSPVSTQGDFVSDKPEKVLQPSSDIFTAPEENPSKYGQMLEDALAGITPTSEPSMSQPAVEPTTPAFDSNPAAASAPAVPANPEINGVPSINYMPMPGEEILPPPPTPPIMPETESATTPEPVAPVASPEVPATPETPVAPAPSTDPGAFKIPGM